MRWKHAILTAFVAATLLVPVVAAAAVNNLVFGAGYAAASNGVPSTARQFMGAGSWRETYPSSKFEVYVDVAAQFGASFTVDQIASVDYKTNNDATNPSNVDFYMVIYTAPFVGGDAAWYGRRLTTEPLYSNGFVPPTANVWNTWNTAAGPNQLTFFDSNHCGNFGFYGAPTLADLQAGAITWNAWPTNLGSGDGVPFDYGAQPVGILSFQTGSGWAAFDGWLDAITVNLTNGDSYVIDLESTVDPLYVDDGWAGSGVGSEVATGRWFGYNAFATVQDAVNAAIPGGTIHVHDGTYTEQVVVDGKNLTIDGASRAGTIIQSPLAMTQFFTTSGLNNFPVVFLKNAADIRVQDLTVDGAGRGNANYRFQGVAFWNAGGKLLNADVKNIEDTPFSGAQHGVAVYANSNTGGPYAVEVGDVAITDFQKNGLTLVAAPLVPTVLNANVHDVVVTGKGATGVTAQNGIQVSGGASATITDCAVSGVAYTGLSVIAASMLLFDGGTVNVTGGSVTNCQFGPYYYDTDGAVSGLNVSAAASVGLGTWGAGLYNSTAGPGANLVAGEGAARSRPPVQPMDEGGVATIGLEAVLSSLSVSFSGGCVTGPGVAGTYGIDVWSAGGPLTATITNNEISNWDTGVWVGGTNVAATTEDNSIAGNLTAGYEGIAGNTHDAENNWWGDAAGPAGAGDDVIGATVDYTPWTITGVDATPGCGFTPAADNAVIPGPAPSCISTVTPCISIPVSIARSSSEGMRGFSVNLTLSGNLALCGSIAEGTYLSSIGGTNFQVLNLGGGNYTVDAAILGLPCGATAATGLLFTLPLTSVAPSGSGTVTINSVILRDCNNAPIAGSAGAPLAITIDNTPPTAVAGLAALQVKTGNDADGTTKVTVSWPAAEAGATVKVYRAGYGNYPEYDDAPGSGSVPAIPSYPPGGPWTLAANVSGPTSLADEVGNRDFWYYVAFVQDACGNVSAVSNMTTGTLNYHLGDTHNGTTNCVGNNLVNTSDISFLGGNYGIVLGVSDALGCLDVGPTTDFSVNARPTTDNQVQFEDLMMFAINYGAVSAPQMASSPVTTASRSTVSLRVPALPAIGNTFAAGVVLASAGDVQGVTVQLDWNRDVLEFVTVENGGLLAAQRGPALALSARPGNVDVAVFGTGVALAGTGEAARVVFRVKAAGEAGLAVRSSEGRDTQNRVVPLDGSAASNVGPVAVSHTGLGVAFPNPFNDQLAIQWSLRRAAPVKLGVFDVTGRRVASLLNGVMEPGQRIERWNGTDDRGVKLAPGYYVLRLEAGEVVQTRTIRLIH